MSIADSAKNSRALPMPTVRPWWKEPYVWMVIAGPVSAVLACAVTFALNQLYAKNLITIMGSIIYTSISMVAGGFASVVIHAASDGDFGASSTFLWYAAGCAVFATVIPIFCINAGLARTSAQTVGMISTISPLVTIIFAIWILGEPFTWADAVGSCLVLLGVGFYTWGDMRQKTAAKLLATVE